MSKPKQKLAREQLFEYAVKSLARRAQTTAELRSKLRAKALEPSDVEDTIGRLKEYGYLDDRRFAEGFASSRLENEQFGRIRTLHDLQTRRVAGPVANAAVEKTYRDTDETALIESYIRRKFRSVPREELFQKEKDLASAYRRLVRAGFRSSAVVSALKRFAKDPGLLDGFEPEAGESDSAD